MQQFVVPQFIDVEDKIIGPITVRQFIMGIVAALFFFLAYKFADLALFVLEAVVIIGFYALFAFIKVNGRPFYYFLLSIIRSIKRPQLRVWNREMTFLQNVPWRESAPTPVLVAPERVRLVEQELSQLSLLVDTGGRYRPEEILQRQKQEKISK
ncbi:MAG: hypothetical protein A3H70_03265 [Candidatus Komeilibacteria bacterium RIFCSPLOWO2_02_FULL_48_11]|uniref:PrgI family protein n=1 Tax=Candidatus Komeilibacteria bacterium RIFCSPLOWO2_02_FULL_48_11 TaxID=1798553 RepID=A0A1G2BRW9_9BACT|nr:MAG: hypothetical protein A3H70_03265 [Candidatus Komeilibacteria bacterium RIFCSPLOWO2_02_FULL_48_11]